MAAALVELLEACKQNVDPNLRALAHSNSDGHGDACRSEPVKSKHHDCARAKSCDANAEPEITRPEHHSDHDSDGLEVWSDDGLDSD